MGSKRKQAVSGNRWVIKVGSSLVTRDGHGLNMEAISSLASQLAALVTAGKQVILTSSGAIAAGMHRLNWQNRPRAIFELQAAAAVGQMGLIQAYESCLQQHNLHSAQVLLTHADLQNRKRYLNARTTLRKLLEMKTLPVVNENDTVATDEIKFGDNDTLAALVSNLIEATTLVILTDREGVYETPPGDQTAGILINEISANDPVLDKAAGPSTRATGRGGMRTKVLAARIAARAGAATIIASGKTPDILPRITRGDSCGSLLLPDAEPLVARKQWIANQLYTRGELVLDDGACAVISKSGKSLLAIGVEGVKGDFDRGEVVSCTNRNGEEIARGLANYSSEEARKLQGRLSTEIEAVLGYVDEPELIHRDNLVIL